MGCSCYNSPEYEEFSAIDLVNQRMKKALPTKRDAFVQEFDRHIAQGHTLSLMKRMGMQTTRSRIALRRLRKWMLSGGRKEKRVPRGYFNMPQESFPDKVDPSGDLDRAWHALILSDTAWYMTVTTGLYGEPLHHKEAVG